MEVREALQRKTKEKAHSDSGQHWGTGVGENGWGKKRGELTLSRLGLRMVGRVSRPLYRLTRTAHVVFKTCFSCRVCWHKLSFPALEG